MDDKDLGRRWLPRDAEALLDAFNAGFLGESHWCDLKREITNNREAAKDMSSFSIDGGTIVVGIDEKQPNGDPRHPVDLKGLPERIEQIARMSVHPPLQITCTPIESGAADGKGYLLVHIPASALAPHQVDGIYYARSDKTTIRMSEPEVERLYQRRAQWNRDAGDLLAGHMPARARFGTENPPWLHVVARPVGGWPDMCQDLVSGPNWRDKIRQLKTDLKRDESIVRLMRAVGMHQDYSWLSSELPMVEKTDRGALLSNRSSPHQTSNPRDRLLWIAEDGELRLFWTGLHRNLGVNDVSYIALELHQVVAIVRELLVVARILSDRCGHSAMWDVGLGLDGTYGVRPLLNTEYHFHSTDHPGYPGVDYRQTTRASVLELQRTPGAVAERLAAKLYRNFDVTDPRLLTVFEDHATEPD